jgi:hypothetical protein
MTMTTGLKTFASLALAGIVMLGGALLASYVATASFGG